VAYHDRSDGGLIVTLIEMAFAGNCGLELDIAALGEKNAALFNEELGAVLQIRDVAAASAIIERHGLQARWHRLGKPTFERHRVVVRHGAEVIIDRSNSELREAWSHTTHQLQRLRDDVDCADEEHAERLRIRSMPAAAATFDVDDDITASLVNERPRVAIVREQGVNGQVEMAAAFHHAGFEAVDVHMSDILSGRATLDGFRGLVACGGFSYGDVLGAGEGWAKSVLFNARARAAFTQYFARDDTFALGVCNGCQMLSNLRDLIPGAGHWPRFVRNRSEQFEARTALVRIEPSPSILLAGMEGSVLPIAVAHGEGRVELRDEGQLQAIEAAGIVGARFVDDEGARTMRYPANPNGSPGGITALCNDDGRVTIMMPHPERVFRAVQLSWRPPQWQRDSPWMRLFRNARVWVG